MQDTITIRGARLHNLKNITLSIPKNKLVVLTGLSGSGKSTLAFDTLHQEALRQFFESVGEVTYLQKPSVDRIEGLSPSISIDQHLTFLGEFDLVEEQGAICHFQVERSQPRPD